MEEERGGAPPPIREGEIEPGEEEAEVRERQARMDRLAHWRQQIAAADTDRSIVRALLPILAEWCKRRGQLTHRLTQVHSGHGCFGEYLYRIKKELTAQCHSCGEAQDVARHTLEECPAWWGLRRVLRGVIGWDHMVGGAGSWKAMASFCEEVMSQKEATERESKRDSLSARRQAAGGRPRPTEFVGPHYGADAEMAVWAELIHHEGGRGAVYRPIPGVGRLCGRDEPLNCSSCQFDRLVARFRGAYGG